MDEDQDEWIIFSVILSELGLPLVPVCVENEVQLFEYLSADKADVLFLDLILPGTDGLKTLKRLRADKRFESLPIVIYTGINPDIYIALCRQENASLFFSKTADLSTLKKFLLDVYRMPWSSSGHLPPDKNFVWQSASNKDRRYE